MKYRTVQSFYFCSTFRCQIVHVLFVIDHNLLEMFPFARVCGSRKYPYPSQRVTGILRGRGFERGKLKSMRCTDA